MEKICKSCNELKPLTEYYICNDCKGGKTRICKICYNNKYNQKNNERRKEKRTRAQSDSEIAMIMLNNLGYTTDNPDYPVAKQFHLKHGFPYKK